MKDFEEILKYIPPAQLTYQEWIDVGMALKHEGVSLSVWDEWSRADSRYHAGECAKKWESFNGSGTPVTGGTLVMMARERGYNSADYYNTALDWDDEIGGIVDINYIENREVSPPAEWNPADEIIRYLTAIFKPHENVGYVTRSWKDKDGRFKPANAGNYDRTAEQLIKELKKCGNDIGAVFGDYNEEAGAWIRFNPLDGKGAKNINVTDFRYALVESDSTDIERQNAIIRELELPCAALVYSGGKSIHAIVKVEAESLEEYKSRVDFLYNICRKNGLNIDANNRNPSRLSRMPGVKRGDKLQYIIDTNIGKTSWNEWREWCESVNDDLPDIENMADVWNDMPQLAPPLIENVLRQGHKMLLAGPSKAGKSYALIELAAAITEGKEWLGWKCAKGRVFYINLELDGASFKNRIKDIYTSLGWEPENIKNLDIWNLRGKSVPMDNLAPKLIRRAAKKNYIAVIIDPIYKVITGDENSADQMSHFCNQFDKVCTELNCAVIYCHHHSKGAQGAKRSMDRASGSGVFARDPDALLDLIELEVPEQLLKEQQNKAACEAVIKYLEKEGYSDKLPADARHSKKAALEACRAFLDREEYRFIAGLANAAEKRAEGLTAWRIEGTLREFPKFPPLNIWFDHPVHKPDGSGALKDAQAESDIPAWQKAVDRHKESSEKKREQNKTNFESAVANCNFGEPPTVKMLAEYMGNVKPDTLRSWVKKYGYHIDRNTGFVEKNDEQTSDKTGDNE